MELKKKTVVSYISNTAITFQQKQENVLGLVLQQSYFRESQCANLILPTNPCDKNIHVSTCIYLTPTP